MSISNNQPKRLTLNLTIRKEKTKDEEWGADNLSVLEDHAKRADRRNAVIQRRFDDEINY